MLNLAESAAATGYDVLLQAMNIVQTICLTYIAARWGALERGRSVLLAPHGSVPPAEPAKMSTGDQPVP